MPRVCRLVKPAEAGLLLNTRIFSTLGAVLVRSYQGMSARAELASPQGCVGNSGWAMISSEPNRELNCVGKDAAIQLKQLGFRPLHTQTQDDGNDVQASLKFLHWTLHLERKCNVCWQRWKYQVCPSSWSSKYRIIWKLYKGIGTGKEEINKTKMYLYVSNSGVQSLLRKLAI